MGRKFKIRDNNGEPFVYINGGRADPRMKIVDEDHPDFKGQRHKFEDDPVGEADVKAHTEQRVAGEFTAELASIEHAKRNDLVELYTRIAGKPPIEGISKQALLAILAEVRSGKSVAEAEEAAKAALAE